MIFRRLCPKVPCRCLLVFFYCRRCGALPVLRLWVPYRLHKPVPLLFILKYPLENGTLTVNVSKSLDRDEKNENGILSFHIPKEQPAAVEEKKHYIPIEG